MSGLQATIDDLEEGGFNFIGNLDLKDALSNQFPGLNNASNGSSTKSAWPSTSYSKQLINSRTEASTQSATLYSIRTAQSVP